MISPSSQCILPLCSYLNILSINVLFALSTSLSFSIFDAIGCSSFSDEIVVQIVDNPIISLTSTAFASSASSSTFCEGESVTFTVSSTSAIATYTFSVGGTPQSVTTTNTFTPSPPLLSSTSSVSVLVVTAAGCTASQTLDMFLNEITSPGNIGQVSTTVCAGETPPAFTNIASATGVGTISYQWQSRTFGTSFADLFGASTSEVYTPTSAINTTTFFVRKAYSTFGGLRCEELSNIVQIAIQQPPISTLQVQGTAISAPATITLCAGEDVTFSAAGGGAVEFLFYLDNNPIGVKSGSSTLSTSTLITGNRIKVQTFDATPPSDTVLGVDIFSVIHTPTQSKIFVSAEDIKEVGIEDLEL